MQLFIDNKEDLPNAIAINSSLNNLSRLLGPALSGFVLARYGAGVCFAINAISFIAVIASLVMMRVPKPKLAIAKKKFSADFSEGLAYVRQHHEIGNTVLVLTLTCLLVGLTLIIFSHTRYFPMNLLLAIVCGFGTMSVIPICNTIIQMAATPVMRGRAISFFTMAAYGTIPIGSLLVGWVSKNSTPGNGHANADIAELAQPGHGSGENRGGH